MVKDALLRKFNRINAASDNSRFVHAITYQELSSAPTRKLDAPTSQIPQKENPAGWAGGAEGKLDVGEYYAIEDTQFQDP